MRKLLFAILILAMAPCAGAFQGLGDFVEDTTHYFHWNTNAGDGSSTAPEAIALHIVKDGNTSSTAGITTSQNIGGTGSHRTTLVLTDAFYETGADYSVLSVNTIDGLSVNATLANFSIQNRYMRGTDSAYTGTPPTVTQIQAEMEENEASTLDDLSDRLTTAQGNITTLISQVGDLYLSRVLVDTTIASAGRAVTTLRLTAGTDQNDAYNGMWVILDSNEGDGVYVSRHISDYDGSNKQVTFTPAVIHDPVDGGLVYIVPGPVHQNTNLDTLLARLTALRAGYLDNLSAGAVAQAAALTTHDSNMATSNALVISTGSTGPWTSADVSGVATAGALATHDGKLDTVDNYIDTEIATIDGEIEDLGTSLAVIVAGVNLTHVNGSAVTIEDTALATEANQLAMMGTGYTSPTHSQVAIRERGDAAWVTANVSALATAAALAIHDTHLTTSTALVLSTGSTGPWTTGSGADQTTTNTAILTAIENATYGLSAIRTRGDAAWVTGGGTDVSTTATATLAAVLAQNDPSVAEIVVGVLAGVVDGTIDVETAIYRILATTYNDATTTPGQIVYLNSAGDDTVSTRTITGTGWSSTP